MHDGDFTTMTEIGKRFDATSHEIGRWLMEIGLRTKFKEPSQQAIDEGFCKRRAIEGVPVPQILWNTAKTIAALEQAGHKQVIKPPMMVMPVNNGVTGPFTLERSGVNGYVVRGGDGTTSIWIYGEEPAQQVIRLFNVAYEHGYFDLGEGEM